MNLLHPLRDVHRRNLLSEPIPAELLTFIESNVSQYSLLTPSEQARLCDDARIFVSEKEWEGAGGFEVTDEVKITIGAQACLLLLGWDDAQRADLFPNVRTIIVYESGFKTEREHAQGVIRVSEPVAELGEAWSSDLPVVLSWFSAREGAESPDDGHNVVLHEFAHKLDTIDGSADGVPRLEDAAAFDNWADVMSREYAELTEDAERGHKTLLDTYGATNEAEFFAVATEAFFERAVRMREEKPRLYEALRGFYGQDTAGRLAA